MTVTLRGASLDEEQVVEAMVAFCREGPSRAHVRDVEVTEEEPERAGGGFAVI